MDDFEEFEEEDSPTAYFRKMGEEWEAHVSLHEMANEALSHEIYAFFEELNGEQIQTMVKILELIARDDQVATLFWGIVLAHRKYKTDLCIACGKNHDDQLKGLTNDDQ